MANPANGIERIQQVFTGLKTGGRKALVIYLMAGDPNPEFTARLVPRLAEAGADLVELGYPFSDPVADGPVIQAASQRALRQFSGLDDYLALVGRIRQSTPVPLVLMTYYNLIFRYGEARFLQSARQAGLDGAILPDLPLEEAAPWRAQALELGVAPIFLEAPNTTPVHAQQIAQASAGFIYLVSLKGVTGSAAGLGENLQDRIQRLRGHTQTPLLVGFGISTPSQARTYGAMSDGVIVGSALVNLLAGDQPEAQKEQAAVDLVKALRKGLDQG